MRRRSADSTVQRYSTKSSGAEARQHERVRSECVTCWVKRRGFDEDRNTIVWVDVAKVDAGWRREPHRDSYTSVEPGRVRKFGRFVQTGRPIRMAEIGIVNDWICFQNGRHRFV